MDIDLSELEGEPYRFDLNFEVEQEDLAEPAIAGKVAVHLVGSVRRLDSGYGLKGSIELNGAIRCARCMSPVPWTAEDSFSYELRSQDEAPREEDVELCEDELEVVFTDSSVLNLAEVAVQQILLCLPMKPLCDDHCAGFCPGCGADLKAGEPCRCGGEEVDPRWAPLLALKNDPDRS